VKNAQQQTALENLEFALNVQKFRNMVDDSNDRPAQIGFARSLIEQHLLSEKLNIGSHQRDELYHLFFSKNSDEALNRLTGEQLRKAFDYAMGQVESNLEDTLSRV
jgi:hypothetical protein